MQQAYHKSTACAVGQPTGVAVVVDIRRLMANEVQLRVGVIGLGAGTLAAYGRWGDHYRFYDINPLVINVATHEFTFVRRGPDGGTTWRYVLAPENGSTRVTESFAQAKLPPGPVQLLGRVLFGADRQALLLESVRTTLDRLKVAAESE